MISIIDLRSNEMPHQDFQSENLIGFWCTLTSVSCIHGNVIFDYIHPYISLLHRYR